MNKVKGGQERRNVVAMGTDRAWEVYTSHRERERQTSTDKSRHVMFSKWVGLLIAFLPWQLT